MLLARRRQHILWQLQPALRVLPELPDLANTQTTAQKRSDARATRGDDARVAGARLSQHQLRFAHALRAANGAFDPARSAEWTTAADCLQHEYLRRCFGAATARRRGGCLPSGSEVRSEEHTSELQSRLH